MISPLAPPFLAHADAADNRRVPGLWIFVSGWDADENCLFSDSYIY